MKKIIFVALLAILSFTFGIFVDKKILKFSDTINAPASPPNTEKKLIKYTIDNLSKAEILPGRFSIKKNLKDEDKFSSFVFEFEFSPDLSQNHKTVTGQINIPKRDSPLAIIVMLRGYIDQKLYTTGDGTRNASEFFAKNGFMTIAPDFLGYGGSDKEADNIFEARFQTYTTVLSLLKTIESFQHNQNLITIPKDIPNHYKITKFLTSQPTVFIWGHSNGGQIALTILEITKGEYPTTLWAPVSAPFPYSILYYTKDSADRGKLIRKELAKFEEFYNPDDFSLDLYLNKINAPLQIHQGLQDEAVPIEWTLNLVSKLEKMGKNFTYYQYEGTDHNMRPVWNKVVERDLEFFNKNLQKLQN